jgi:hypothetical protein
VKSASMYAVLPAGPLTINARAWVSTSVSLST